MQRYKFLVQWPSGGTHRYYVPVDSQNKHLEIGNSSTTQTINLIQDAGMPINGQPSIKLIAPELINDNATQNELGNSWHYDDAIEIVNTPDLTSYFNGQCLQGNQGSYSIGCDGGGNNCKYHWNWDQSSLSHNSRVGCKTPGTFYYQKENCNNPYIKPRYGGVANASNTLQVQTWRIPL